MNTFSSKISSMSFGMVSADFRHFMTDLCISLFYSVFASKSRSLLIMDNIISPLSKWRGVGGEVTNQFQREFLFNNCIQSQEFSSASKQSRQKTNLFKLTCVTCAVRTAGTSRRQLLDVILPQFPLTFRNIINGISGLIAHPQTSSKSFQALGDKRGQAAHRSRERIM
jgi:hypothetical protein